MCNTEISYLAPKRPHSLLCCDEEYLNDLGMLEVKTHKKLDVQREVLVSDIAQKHLETARDVSTLLGGPNSLTMGYEDEFRFIRQFFH